MKRAELVKVIKSLNQETELLKEVGEGKIIISGKGSSDDELKENFKQVMLKLNQANLIDSTPEDAIDFWEANLDTFGVVAETKEVVEEKEVVKDKDKVKDSVEEEKGKKKKKKKTTEKSRYGHKLGTQSAILDELFFKGTTLEKAAEKIDAKVGRVKGHMKHLIHDKDLVIKADGAGVYKVSE